MSETFCCMICRLLQDRSPACIECGAATMISLERGGEALRFGNLELHNTPATRKARIANVAGTAAIIAGYGGLVAGSLLWWPAIPIILGLGGGGIGLVAWRSRGVEIAPVEAYPVKVADDAVEKRGIARKLTDSVRSVLDGAPVLVEQAVIRAKGVLLRRTNVAPFILDVDGERIVVAGVVRVGNPAATTKLKQGDPVLAALGIPATLAVAGKLDIVQIRDGDTVTIKGALSVEMVSELAFHRDAGETRVMRGGANAVIAISG